MLDKCNGNEHSSRRRPSSLFDQLQRLALIFYRDDETVCQWYESNSHLLDPYKAQGVCRLLRTNFITLNSQSMTSFCRKWLPFGQKEFKQGHGGRFYKPPGANKQQQLRSKEIGAQVSGLRSKNLPLPDPHVYCVALAKAGRRKRWSRIKTGNKMRDLRDASIRPLPFYQSSCKLKCKPADMTAVSTLTSFILYWLTRHQSSVGIALSLLIAVLTKHDTK
ncbi:hypothetical protein T03_597 [Trichinella britovi]|uniref:Uncharacterized protein n=1 Tax=Trichinella britovi TaxID=45882 RepID=A0A0V1DHY6_TRIBR|nr:hypothetical protein T03_597 [Trichinella britovi]